MNTKIIGIGACVFDTLISLPCYPPEDSKQEAENVAVCGGGPAATGVVAAAKLGVLSAFFGNLANDAGGQFLWSDFEKYGVSTAGITRVNGCRSFASHILLSRESATRTCVFSKGDLPHFNLTDDHKRMIKQAEILLVDGNDLDSAIEAAKIAQAAKTTVLYDAGSLYKGVEKLLPLVDILIPSEEFAIGHTGADTAEQSAALLWERYHAKAIVITQGNQGGLLYKEGKMIRYPIYPANVIDSNGAGDVFHGAFAAGLVKGYSLEQCCHYASAVSALKCTGFGARESVPDHKTVLQYMEGNGFEL